MKAKDEDGADKAIVPGTESLQVKAKDEDGADKAIVPGAKAKEELICSEPQPPTTMSSLSFAMSDIDSDTNMIAPPSSTSGSSSTSYSPFPTSTGSIPSVNDTNLVRDLQDTLRSTIQSTVNSALISHLSEINPLNNSMTSPLGPVHIRRKQRQRKNKTRKNTVTSSVLQRLTRFHRPRRSHRPMESPRVSQSIPQSPTSANIQEVHSHGYKSAGLMSTSEALDVDDAAEDNNNSKEGKINESIETETETETENDVQPDDYHNDSNSNNKPTSAFPASPVAGTVIVDSCIQTPTNIESQVEIEAKDAHSVSSPTRTMQTQTLTREFVVQTEGGEGKGLSEMQSRLLDVRSFVGPEMGTAAISTTTTTMTPHSTSGATGSTVTNSIGDSNTPSGGRSRMNDMTPSPHRIREEVLHALATMERAQSMAGSAMVDVGHGDMERQLAGQGLAKQAISSDLLQSLLWLLQLVERRITQLSHDKPMSSNQSSIANTPFSGLIPPQDLSSESLRLNDTTSIPNVTAPTPVPTPTLAAAPGIPTVALLDPTHTSTRVVRRSLESINLHHSMKEQSQAATQAKQGDDDDEDGDHQPTGALAQRRADRLARRKARSASTGSVGSTKQRAKKQSRKSIKKRSRQVEGQKDKNDKKKEKIGDKGSSFEGIVDGDASEHDGNDESKAKSIISETTEEVKAKTEKDKDQDILANAPIGIQDGELCLFCHRIATPPEGPRRSWFGFLGTLFLYSHFTVFFLVTSIIAVIVTELLLKDGNIDQLLTWMLELYSRIRGRDMGVCVYQGEIENQGTTDIYDQSEL